MLTLTGPSGVGKTRLAVELCALLAPDFPDGVAWLPLASLRDASSVVPMIARTLGVVESSRPMADSLAAALRDAHLLLVLDNLEHLLDAGPALADLLAACPNLALLVTSQAMVRVRGERAFPVPPLEVGRRDGGTAGRGKRTWPVPPTGRRRCGCSRSARMPSIWPSH